MGVGEPASPMPPPGDEPLPVSEKRMSQRRQAFGKADQADMIAMLKESGCTANIDSDTEAQLRLSQDFTRGQNYRVACSLMEDAIEERVAELKEQRWGNVNESPQFASNLLRTNEVDALKLISKQVPDWPECPPRTSEHPMWPRRRTTPSTAPNGASPSFPWEGSGCCSP